MKTKALSEKEITQSIRSYLNAIGIFHWKNWGGPMSKEGVSDILGSHKGQLIAIEVKTAIGRVTDKQRQFLDSVNSNGGLGFVARSVDDVITRFEPHKLQSLAKGELGRKYGI